MTREAKPRRQFDLHTLFLWFMPYAALCLLVLTSFRTRFMSPGPDGIPMLHWKRFVIIGVITLVWSILVWEDRRARRRNRQRGDRQPE
jgi:type VI protein secretion system component VasK